MNNRNRRKSHFYKEMSQFLQKKFLLFRVVLLVCCSTSTAWCTAITRQSHWQQLPPPDESTTSRSYLRAKDAHRDISPHSPGSHNLSLELGQVFLLGDLTHYSNNIGTQLHYTYGVSDLFGFDSGLGYSEHSEGQFSLTSLTTGMRTNLSWYDKVIPYITFGLGFYRPSYPDQSPEYQKNLLVGRSSISAILFGVHFGTGIDLELSKILFFGASLNLYNQFGTTRMLPGGTPFYLGGSYTTFYVHLGCTL